MSETMVPDMATGVQLDTPETILYGDHLTQLNLVLDELSVNDKYNAPPAKLQKAYEACLHQRVHPTETPGHFHVDSTQPAEGRYQVHEGTCTCKYAVTHPSERYGCYHSVAAVLWTRWQQNVTPLGAPLAIGSLPPVPASMPLAPKHVSPAVRELEDHLAVWSDERKVLARFIKHHLIEGSDYGKIHIKRDCKERYTCTNPYHFSKDCLFKAGSEKFVGLLRLRATFRKDEDTWEMIGRQPGVLCLICELSTAGGEIVGEGRGIREVTKDGGDYNKSIKMAQKSAMSDAILRTGCLSDVFTQDVDDTPAEPLRAVGTAEKSVTPRASMRSQIASLLDTLGETPQTRDDYASIVLARTKFALEPANYQAIVRVLAEQVAG